MYEHRSQPVLPFGRFIVRVVRHLAVGLAIILCSLALGVLGYHFFGDLTWLDSLLNASMILGGMGPVDVLHASVGKLFASFYALFAGIVFLVVVSLLMAPVGHRLLHSLHVEEGR